MEAEEWVTESIYTVGLSAACVFVYFVLYITSNSFK
jgi:hypothetical protein